MGYLIHEISELTFNENDLKLYARSDIEREYDLLQIWTQEQRKLTLDQIGFKDGVTYNIDADNYQEASDTPVKVHADRKWQIVKSGKNGPVFHVGPGTSGDVHVDSTSWVSYRLFGVEFTKIALNLLFFYREERKN